MKFSVYFSFVQITQDRINQSVYDGGQVAGVTYTKKNMFRFTEGRVRNRIDFVLTSDVFCGFFFLSRRLFKISGKDGVYKNV